MTNNEQLKKDRELLDNAYNDYLSLCTRIAGDNSRTGIEAVVAFERVKNYSNNLLAAQERVTRAEIKDQMLDKIHEFSDTPIECLNILDEYLNQ